MKEAHPFLVIKISEFLIEFWYDDKMDGQQYEYYTNSSILKKNHPNIQRLFPLMS